MTPECVSAVADSVVAIAAVLATCFAWRGLMTWQQEMRGRTEYETARRLLRSAYKVRNAFYYIRSPVDIMSGPEPGEDQADRIERRFQEKWQVLAEAMNEMETEATDAEVLWGQKVEKDMEVIRSCRITLYMAIADHIEFMRTPDRASPEQRRKVRGTVYAHAGGEELSQDIRKAIKGIEDQLRPLLNQKR